MVGVAVERVVAETGLVLGVAGLVGPIGVRFMASAPAFFGAQPGPQELISISQVSKSIITVGFAQSAALTKLASSRRLA